MIRNTALVVFLAALLVGTAYADHAVTVTGIAAGGTTHLVIYPLNDPSKALRVESALPTIVTTYEKLWKSKNSVMAFPLLIDIGLEAPKGDDLSDTTFELVKLPVPSAPAAWTGTTESNATNVCHMKLFSAAQLNTPNELEFELAVGVAHCYLQNYISAERQDWWYEGLARWMAVQVYTPPPAALGSLQKDYQDNYNSNVFDTGKEALYFWEYLLGKQIQNPPFSDLPILAQSFGNGAKQFLLLTPELFYGYANTVADERLSWQPTPDDLADDTDLSFSSLPADVELNLEENAIYITNVTLPELKEGEGVTITGNGLADSGTMVGIGSAGSYTPIGDSQSLDLCGQTGFTVIAGRAVPANLGSGAISGPSLTLSLKKDCQKAKLPPCIVGTWQQDVPYTSTNGFVALDGLLQHTYHADGNLTHTYSNYTVTYHLPNQKSSTVTYVGATFSGNMSAEADPMTPGRYTVTAWHRQMEPGGEVTQQMQNGQMVDVTKGITEQYFGDSVPSYFVCERDDDKNKHWTAHLVGKSAEALGVTDLSFTRVP